jgi:hypothetical protein
MKTKFRITTIGLTGFIALAGVAEAAKVTPDLLPPQRRQTTVTLAESLAERKAPPPLPENLVSPFNPTDFERNEAQEQAAARAAAASSDSRSGPTPPPAPLGDRQILEVLAAQLTPTGTMQISGSPRLVMGSKRFEIGTRFTVTYNNEDYELELTSIDRTTFTLRYRGEEITRPIKLVR